MIYKDFKILASPHFADVRCPKCRNDMVELDNGWFEVCWYCKHCEYPYTLKLVKMKNVNIENLNKALEKKNDKKI